MFKETTSPSKGHPEGDVGDSLIEQNQPAAVEDEKQGKEFINLVGLVGPFVPVTFSNNNTFLCLCDTGCHINVVSKNLLENINLDNILTKTNLELAGISGKNLNVVGSVTLNITIGDREKDLQFIVIENKDILILGLTGMKTCEVVIDVAADTIMCNGLTLQFDN